MRYLLHLFLFFVVTLQVTAATIKGKVQDNFKEPLIGANVTLRGTSKGAIVGLDGSFAIHDLPAGTYQVIISFIGYVNHEQEIILSSEQDIILLQAELKQDATQLGEVTISVQAENGSDAQARSLERTSSNTLNVISAKAIALSPDLSVANVIQRVSGLSVERNANGDPQYAIIRGMDKRYSYTLVNGVKIPGPDNKNRYVPLDIFPASLLERLEVYKSLTADQEGDAIGGGINMVMKSAPDKPEIKGDFQMGYNTINARYGFDEYNSGVVSKLSPREKYGDAYLAQPSDFTKKNLEVKNVTPLPDVIASFSIGNRFLRDKLGVMVGSSFQNANRGTKSLWFDYDTDRFGSNLPSLRAVQDRHYSTQQTRAAVHARLDYKINHAHELKVYSGYYKLINREARQITETFLDGRAYSSENGNAILQYSTRTKNTDLSILTTSLQGNHKVMSPLLFSWLGVYSIATNDQPDNARFIRNGELINFREQPQNIERRNSRQWTNNKDTDFTGSAHLTFQPEAWGKSRLKAGGMIRRKDRNNYFNLYYFDPNPSLQVQGVNWNTYTDVKWQVINPVGSATNELNYNAHENITAFYLLCNWNVSQLELNAGVRIENTDQGYDLKYPKADQRADSTQAYTDVLPSLSAKYKIRTGMNLRFTYYKGISRPAFFEIVPYQLEDDGYKEYGNPSLKRVRAHNVDLRWEKFSNATDQILIGVFYKYIMDPIEYAIVRKGITNEPVMQPNNFGTARNSGIEVDFTHYFNKFGLRANYTFTHSRITTSKVLRTREDINDPSSDLVLKEVTQTRSLQGQATHVGNLSLLYKDIQKGWESQLSMVYTGERLESISPFLDNDIYSRPIIIMDFALEKKIAHNIDVFVKASNLLNSAYQMYVKKPVYQENDTVYPYQEDAQHKTLVRKDQYYQSFRIGARIQWNKN